MGFTGFNNKQHFIEILKNKQKNPSSIILYLKQGKYGYQFSKGF